MPLTPYKDELDEVLESLIERETQEEEVFLFLSPAGYILHEKCRHRTAEAVPPLRKARCKTDPRSGKGHLSAKQTEIQDYMQRVIDGNSFVTTCRLFYTNPDLPEKNQFRVLKGIVTGVYSDGTFTAKFEVETTAEVESQKWLAVEQLNQWLATNG